MSSGGNNGRSNRARNARAGSVARDVAGEPVGGDAAQAAPSAAAAEAAERAQGAQPTQQQQGAIVLTSDSEYVRSARSAQCL